jgi:hypothetical protein
VTEAASPGQIVCAAIYITRSHLIIKHFHASDHCVTETLRYTVRQCVAMLLYIVVRPEQKCARGNVMKNNVCCLICVCSCFEMISKFYILW